MPDHHFHLVTVKNDLLRKFTSDILAIYIAINPFQWLKGSEFVCNFDRTKITGMPYFTAMFEVLKNIYIQKTVCVRYKTDLIQ